MEKKKGDFGSRTELHRVVDAPRRGPAAGTASRRDRWGKEGGLVNIYITNCYFYSRIPPLSSVRILDLSWPITLFGSDCRLHSTGDKRRVYTQPGFAAH